MGGMVEADTPRAAMVMNVRIVLLNMINVTSGVIVVYV
jgi:hypothetical protein